MADAGKTLWCVGCGEGFTSAMPSGTRCLDCEKAPAVVDWRARALAAEAALEMIARAGCMQSSEEPEFWCKRDGSAHSIYCPAGVARRALEVSRG